MIRPVTFTPPATVGGIGHGLGAALSTVGQSLQDGAGGLSGLGLPAVPPLPDMPSAQALRGQSDTILTKQANYFCVSPYQYGVGQRRGEEALLTPKTALKAVAAALQRAPLPVDAGDMRDTALLMLVMARAEHGQLAESLAGLNTLFPLPDLAKLERRAKAMARLETEKFIIPPTPTPHAAIPWQSCAPQKLLTSRKTGAAIGTQLAQAEGLEASAKAPSDVLAAFGQRQAAAGQQAVQSLQECMDSLTGQVNGLYGLYLEGVVAVLAKVVADFAAGALPDVLSEAYKCTACVCWYGSKDELAYYKELFGL